jgi:hypothetical protein
MKGTYLSGRYEDLVRNFAGFAGEVSELSKSAGF